MRAAGVRGRLGRLLLVAILASTAWAVLWYRRIAPEPEEPPAGHRAAAPGSADMVLRDFRHAETRMDRTVWVLEASQAEVFQERASLRRVKITWYGEEGDSVVVVTSRAGHVDLQTRNAVLAGDVRIVRDDGARLKTSRIVWNNAHRMLRAPLPVVVRTEGFTLRGRNMRANVERRRVRIGGRVSGEIHHLAGLFGGAPAQDDPPASRGRRERRSS